MVERLHYRRQNHYRTKSNAVRRLRTPGGKLVFQNVRKSYGRHKCGDCKRPLPGLPAKSPAVYRRLKKRERTVNRAYGGTRCHRCVREKIIRAFLLEEQRRVKLVLLEKEKQRKEDSAASKTEKKKKSSSGKGKERK